MRGKIARLKSPVRHRTLAPFGGITRIRFKGSSNRTSQPLRLPRIFFRIGLAIVKSMVGTSRCDVPTPQCGVPTFTGQWVRIEEMLLAQAQAQGLQSEAVEKAWPNGRPARVGLRLLLL